MVVRQLLLQHCESKKGKCIVTNGFERHLTANETQDSLLFLLREKKYIDLTFCVCVCVCVCVTSVLFEK